MYFRQPAIRTYLTMTLALSTSAMAMSNESKLLAECEFIYSYTAQILQLQNNTGGAVNLLRRSSMMSTANLISNAHNGVVSGSLIRSWTELRPPIKNRFDTQRADPIAEATRCDRTVVPIAIKVRETQKMLWGKTLMTYTKRCFKS